MELSEVLKKKWVIEGVFSNPEDPVEFEIYPDGEEETPSSTLKVYRSFQDVKEPRPYGFGMVYEDFIEPIFETAELEVAGTTFELTQADVEKIVGEAWADV